MTLEDALANARILMIDDGLDNAQLIFELLSLRGLSHFHHEIDPARSMRTFCEFRPDLVILGLQKAPRDGFRVLSDLQALIEDGVYLPILVLTGDRCPRARERALEAGAMDYLSGWSCGFELLLRVKNLLQTRMLYLALQLERDRLKQRVEERTRDLMLSEGEMLRRLAQVAEYRDDETGCHIRRVGRIVECIAVELGIDETTANLMGRAALLHDIGKIAIRDTILLKPDRLTPSEFEEMKEHTRLGGEILGGSRSAVLAVAESIARFHHEKWDGTGYGGLAGWAIPLEARVTSVADVYDALRNARPYKPGWTHREAVNEIERLSGTSFDPEVVEAFLRIQSKLPCLYRDHGGQKAAA